MAKAGTIRGLQVFIADVRACQNREQETKRVDKELAKIRKKFSSDKGSLSGGWRPRGARDCAPCSS
jgi:AP-2 complex subunit alpha